MDVRVPPEVTDVRLTEDTRVVVAFESISRLRGVTFAPASDDCGSRISTGQASNHSSRDDLEPDRHLGNVVSLDRSLRLARLRSTQNAGVFLPVSQKLPTEAVEAIEISVIRQHLHVQLEIEFSPCKGGKITARVLRNTVERT
jgi:hypothetical protein